MTTQAQGERLAYWLTGLECGVLSPEQISDALDEIILQGAGIPEAWLEAAWNATKGRERLLHALREGLEALGLDWNVYSPLEVYWALRGEIRRGWARGEWDMEAAIFRLYRLAQCYYPEADTGELYQLSDDYELAVVDGYGSIEQVAEQFVALIHREPDGDGPLRR